MNELIDQLADICVDEFGGLPNNAWGEIEHIEFDLNTLDPNALKRILAQGYLNLPAGIGRIRIHRYDGLVKNECFNGVVVVEK
jgi:hypothetical protein